MKAHNWFLSFTLVIGVVIFQQYIKKIYKRAVERGLGWHNPLTGKFEWTDKDVKYAIYGNDEVNEELIEK